MAYLRPAWRALAKFEAQIPDAVREEISGLVDAVEIQTARSMPADGYEDVYERIKDAIVRKESLACRYESLDGRSDAEESEFEPYCLFFGTRAWYAIGFHSRRESLRSLKLNRFAKVTTTGRTYEIPENFTVKDYFGNAWRMIRGKHDHRVELHVTTEFAQTVSDTRWHHTQEVEFHEGGSATFRCTVAGLGEIVWHEPHCKIMTPEELWQKVVDLP